MVVIGIGNSGADVAGEISRVAEQVWCLTLLPAEKRESRLSLWL